MVLVGISPAMSFRAIAATVLGAIDLMHCPSVQRDLL
jgi:hypothetical protein